MTQMLRLRQLLLGCTIIAGGAYPASLFAAPNGPSFDPSRVSVTQSGADTTVTQNTAHAVIDWRSFDLLQHESVNFVQPGSEAATLNRVQSARASSIDGTITANGRIIIQNANGVIFGGSAKIDVGALVATTLDVDPHQFLDSGRLVLGPSGGAGEIRNSGTITAADRGFVALIGSKVTNEGLIQARLGSVALAAGTAATIDFAGDGLVQIAITDPATEGATGAGALVANKGRISADGGSVLLTARGARDVVTSAINLDGLVEARSVGTQGGMVALIGDSTTDIALTPSATIDVSGNSGSGGTAALTGAKVSLASGATIDASGSDKGGTILVGGERHGGGALAHALDVEIARGANLNASGAAGGGEVVVWSDRSTLFDGSALARANNAGARGGLVETSSKGRLAIGDDAVVSTANPNGMAGIWLLDPTSISIVASGGVPSPDDANNATGASEISASTVVSALASNQVHLIAENFISVDAPLVATSLGGAPNGLQLIVTGVDSQIRVNAPILLQDGNLALRAEGDILLGTLSPTETDFTRRAIIALGTGTLWMQTRATGSIIQAGNSAILAQNIAAAGGSVSLESWDNFTLNLAGSARGGDFVFHETNASSDNPAGTVVDPFIPQSISGVNEYSTLLLETQELVANRSPTTVDDVRTLALTGSPANPNFDTLVFSALPYQQLGSNPWPPPPEMTDSSDYAISSLAYTIGGVSYSFTPESPAGNRPAGFQLSAAGGSVIQWIPDVFSNEAWGVDGFRGVGGTDPNEIGYDPIQNISENLIVSLGGQTTSVSAALRLFFAPDFGNAFAEAAQVQYYRTDVTPGTIDIRQQTLTGTADSVSRTYGTPNPTFGFDGPAPTFLDVDRYVASQIAGYDLPVLEITTTATQFSDAGPHPLIITALPASTFFSQRYDTDFHGGTLTITPAQLTLTANDLSRVYGDDNPALTYGVTGWLNNDNTTTSATAVLSTLATITSNVSDYAIAVGAPSLTGTAAGNYTLVTHEGTLTITPAPLLVSADNLSRIYGEANPLLTASASGWKNADEGLYALNASLSTTATPTTHVGAAPITVTAASIAGPNPANYSISTANGSLTITPATLTVGAHDAIRVYGETNPAFTYGVSGWKNDDVTTNTVTATLATPATVTSNVGDYDIDVLTSLLTGPNSGDYILANLPGTLTITPAQLTVAADNQSRIFGDPNPPLTATTTGWLNNDDATTTVDAVLSTPATITSNVGSYEITVDSASLSGPAAGNYVLNRLPGTLLITVAQLLLVSANNYSRVYGSANPAFTFQVAGWRNNDEQNNSVSATLGSTATITSNVGNYAITVSNPAIIGPAAGNYGIQTQDGTLTITPAPLLVSADNLSRIYGETNPLLTASASGWKNADEGLYALNASLSTTATPATHVGAAPITVTAASIAGPNPANYSISTANGSLAITPATLTVGAHDAIRVYGETNPAFTYGVSGWKNDDVTTNTVTATLATPTTVTSNVGDYDIDVLTSLLTGPNSGDYILANLPGTLTITPAQLTLTANDLSRVYGDDNPALTYGVTGWLNNDNTNTSATAVLSTLATLTSDVGDYAIAVGAPSLTGTAAGNYTLVTHEGTLTITPAPLLVSADNLSRIYGEANPLLTASASGWKNADEGLYALNASLSTTATPTTHVGAAPITVTAASIAGPNPANYSISTANGSLTITPAPLTVSVGQYSKVFGDPDPLFLYNVTGLRNDDLSADVLSGNILRAAGEDVGNYVIGQGTLDLISANYALSFIEGNLAISPASLVIRAIDVSRIYGDPDPVFDFDVEGLRFNDTASGILTGALGRDPGENVGIYAIRPGSLALNTGNYVLTFESANLTITPAALLVTGGNFTRIYGDPDPAFTFDVSGLRNDDTAAAVLEGRLSRDPGENVGTYAVLQGSLSLASRNYVMTYVDGSLDITPAPLIVRANPHEKIVGAPDPLLTFGVEGLRLGDTIDIVTGRPVRDPGEEVGKYPIRQGTIAIDSPNYTLEFIDALFTIRNLTDDLDVITSGFFDPWRIHHIERGRDPDTPGDAVYRTTVYENPYIPDPLMRGYALGYILLSGADPADWRDIDNDRTGQHADRPEAQPCPSAATDATIICRAAEYLQDYWTGSP